MIRLHEGFFRVIGLIGAPKTQPKPRWQRRDGGSGSDETMTRQVPGARCPTVRPCSSDHTGHHIGTGFGRRPSISRRISASSRLGAGDVDGDCRGGREPRRPLPGDGAREIDCRDRLYRHRGLESRRALPGRIGLVRKAILSAALVSGADGAIPMDGTAYRPPIALRRADPALAMDGLQPDRRFPEAVPGLTLQLAQRMAADHNGMDDCWSNAHLVD